MNIIVVDETMLIGMISIVAGTFLAVRIRARKGER